MEISLIVLAITLTGYFSARLIDGDRVELGHLLLFGLGIFGLFSFWNIVIWNELTLQALFAFDFLSLVLVISFLRRNHNRLFVPIAYRRVDFIVLFFLFFAALSFTYGMWDAWAMWNTKAKFLATSEWRQMFTQDLDWMHPDYPLLLPSMIAGGWTMFGAQSYWVPVLLNTTFAWSIYLVLRAELTHWFGKIYGLLGSLLLVSIPFFLETAISQYADLPLAAFLAASLLLLNRANDSKTIVLSGLLMGFAAFTKNEGQLYFLLGLAAWGYTCWSLKKPIPFRSMIFWVAGALPGLVSAFLIKHYAPQNEFVFFLKTTLATISIQKIFFILKYFIYLFFSWDWIFFWIAVIPFLLLTRRFLKNDFLNTFFSSFLLLAFASFFFIYLLTPHNVEWHITTSFERLLLQLLPLAIFLFFVRLKAYLPQLKSVLKTTDL